MVQIAGKSSIDRVKKKNVPGIPCDTPSEKQPCENIEENNENTYEKIHTRKYAKYYNNYYEKYANDVC